MLTIEEAYGRSHRHVPASLGDGTFIKMARMSARQYLIRFYKQTHSDGRATHTCNEFTSRPGTIASFIHSRERLSSPLPFARETIMNSMVSDNSWIDGGVENIKQKRNARVSTVIYIGGERSDR